MCCSPAATCGIPALLLWYKGEPHAGLSPGRAFPSFLLLSLIFKLKPFSASVCVYLLVGGVVLSRSLHLLFVPRAIANSLQMVSVAVPGPEGGRAGEELGLDAASEVIVCRPVIQVADKAPLTLRRTRSGSVVNPGEPAAAGVTRGWTCWDMALAAGMCSGRFGARAALLSTLTML